MNLLKIQIYVSYKSTLVMTKIIYRQLLIADNFFLSVSNWTKNE